MSSQLGGALSKRHVGGPDPGGGVRRRRLLSAAAAIALAAGLAPVASNAAHGAATPLVAPAINPVVASSTQFDITGFLQTATVDSRPTRTRAARSRSTATRSSSPRRRSSSSRPAHSRGRSSSPTHRRRTGLTQTGMALDDNPKPHTTYEVHVVGNRVIDANGDRYIAGLVHISQQDLNSGAGYINYIDYSTGTMEVGGKPGVKDSGAPVRINDPGRPPRTRTAPTAVVATAARGPRTSGSRSTRTTRRSSPRPGSRCACPADRDRTTP